MSDDRLFMIVEGIGPADIEQDEPAALANDIFGLICEEYDKEEIEGVIPVVNLDAHEELTDRC
ncbi:MULTISPECIES: hypothetical protein [Haloarcula]|uniref:Uncharacterized protein n=1 Tax=Haloarcula argentinensis TaxID=43776 RepID=A0A830FI87_HALAR|nr:MULTISPECIES: hypothetical protein [Haloarcula]MDQ2074821.1 hypothetical protein [Haloarcula sp. H-GB4]GGM49263.1 hypothetical protein GCM10009006_33200 [Haloarcula argentinensis]